MQLFLNTLYLLLSPALVFALALFGKEFGRCWLSLGLGTLISLALAVVRRATKWINNEFFTLGLLTLGMLIAISVMVFRTLSRQRYQVLVTWLVGGLTTILAISALPDTFLQIFGIVPMNETLLSSGAITNLAGYLAGAVLAVLISWGSYRGATGASKRILVSSAALITGLWVVGSLITVLRICLGRNLIPKWGWLFHSIAFGTNNFYLVSWLMLLAALLPLISALRRGSLPVATENPAKARLHKAALISRRRFFALAIAGTGIAVAGELVRDQLTTAVPTLSPPEEMLSDANNVLVDLALVEDGHLHRFAYTGTKGVEVRFIVIRKNARAYGVGLDACNVCGPTGYYERDDQVICKLCDVAMNVQTIGFKGGCNPIPLAYTLADSKLVVTKTDLEKAQEVFA